MARCDGNRERSEASGRNRTKYFYDPTGRLLTETTGIPGTGKDYVYLGGGPVARVDWSVDEFDLGNVLRVNKSDPNVQLDWTLYSPPSPPNTYVVRRKQVVNPNDKTFNGSAIVATLTDTQNYNDPALSDGNRYDYRVLRRVVTEALRFYHTDHLGTPIAMTDGGGSLVWRAEHLPFGGIWSLPVSTAQNNLRFPGQYFDGETGLHQNFHRWYNSKTGRYLKPDPLGDTSFPEIPLPPPDADTETAGSLYNYAGDSPTNYIDPLGLLRFKGCTPEQEIAIGGALVDYCKRVTGQQFLGCMCDKPSIPGRLMRACGDPNLTVRCKANSDEQCGNACAWSIPFGRTIRLCPSGWKSGICGPLGCTLLHEITHQIGHLSERRPEQVERCLGCQ